MARNTWMPIPTMTRNSSTATIHVSTLPSESQGRTVRAVAGWVTVAAVVLLGAGCGGPEPLTRSEYRDRLEAIAAELSVRLSDGLSRVRRGADPAEAAGAVRRAAAAMDRTAADLEALLPPEDAAAANRSLARGVRLFGDELRRLAQLTQSREDQRVRQYLQTASRGATPALVAIDDAFGDLRASGYLGG
jgi:hypothetical protein